MKGTQQLLPFDSPPQFTPATELDDAAMKPFLDFFFMTPVNLIHAVLPKLVERGSGAVLVAQGASEARSVLLPSVQV
jgi:short-subunit dehydrogenase